MGGGGQVVAQKDPPEPPAPRPRPKESPPRPARVTLTNTQNLSLAKLLSMTDRCALQKPGQGATRAGGRAAARGAARAVDGPLARMGWSMAPPPPPGAPPGATALGGGAAVAMEEAPAGAGDLRLGLDVGLDAALPPPDGGPPPPGPAGATKPEPVPTAPQGRRGAPSAMVEDDDRRQVAAHRQPDRAPPLPPAEAGADTVMSEGDEVAMAGTETGRGLGFALPPAEGDDAAAMDGTGGGLALSLPLPAPPLPFHHQEEQPDALAAADALLAGAGAALDWIGAPHSAGAAPPRLLPLGDGGVDPSATLRRLRQAPEVEAAAGADANQRQCNGEARHPVFPGDGGDVSPLSPAG